MAVSKKRNSSDDDFLKVGPDATATFDNSPSNPTEHASSEHLDDLDTEEDGLEDEDLDEDEDEDDEEEEEEEYDDEDEDDEDDEDDDDEDEGDDDLATGPRAPGVYRRI